MLGPITMAFGHFSSLPQLTKSVPLNVLDTVVLVRDLPEHGLRRGDLGAIVDVYPPDGLEVELVLASGRTQALVTLRTADVRTVQDGDLRWISARPARPVT
jgi:hypothetical protein